MGLEPCSNSLVNDYPRDENSKRARIRCHCWTESRGTTAFEASDRRSTLVTSRRLLGLYSDITALRLFMVLTDLGHHRLRCDDTLDRCLFSLLTDIVALIVFDDLVGLVPNL